ncbi:MAG TPA: hypothetical protein VN851_02880 [Thermoanaerobaculia bacterium]|nr:hypothetical protein [Thermoanaerobaculia bacterium]
MALAPFDDTPAFPPFDLGPDRLAEYEELPLYRSPVFPEIQFDLEAFWREVDEELALA